MKIIQEKWTSQDGWVQLNACTSSIIPQLVFCFGNRELLAKKEVISQIQNRYPSAELISSSTSGQFANTHISDFDLILTAIEFEETPFVVESKNIKDFDTSFEAGIGMLENLEREGLRYIFVLCDGQQINGSELVRGLNLAKKKETIITGGLAGDDYNFSKTLVGHNSKVAEGNIVIIGFYGDRLNIGFGSKGGWDSFGPKRKITKSKSNVLYELDGQSALSLYKKYLGDFSKELPSSALYFPLSIETEYENTKLVRTILSVDETSQSMTFAGDMPEGIYAQLMKHNPDKLIDGAEAAAQQSIELGTPEKAPDLALLVSCVGRKYVLGHNMEEELAVVRDTLGQETTIAGFYSYGEIAPSIYPHRSELHNQTMTITTFTEI